MALEAPSRLGCTRALGWWVRVEFGALSNVIGINIVAKRVSPTVNNMLVLCTRHFVTGYVV